MRPYLVVIVHVRLQHVTEVALTEHNDVVKAFPSDRTDQPFGISVLPWGARRCRPVTNAHRSKSSDEDLTIGPIPVTDQVAGSLFPTACFRDLICDPFCSGVSCDAKPQNLSSAVPQISNPRAGETRSSARRTNPSPRCHRHGYEETSSSLATVALVSSPYTWPRSSGRYRCRA